MKKTLPYMVTAIVLGVVVMLLPLRLLYTVPTEATYVMTCPSYAEDLQNFKFESITCPSSPLFTGLTFILSLVFALGVSLYVKRRMF